MNFTDIKEVTYQPRQTLFYTRDVKVEADSNGELYFNGSKATLRNIKDNLYTAYGLIYRYKSPRKVIGARKRKKALTASLRKYAIRIRFYKED